MNRWVYIAISTVFAFFIFQDLINMEMLETCKQRLESASSDELVLYASQGFYYLTMLIGVIFILVKFKKRTVKE